MKLNVILSTCALGVCLVSTGCGANMYDNNDRTTGKLGNNVSRSVRNSVNDVTDYYSEPGYANKNITHNNRDVTRNYNYRPGDAYRSNVTGQSNLERNDYNNVVGNRNDNLSNADLNIDGNNYGVRDQNMYNYKVQRDASINDFEAYTTNSDVGYYNNRALDTDKSISKRITANAGALTNDTVNNRSRNHYVSSPAPSVSVSPSTSNRRTTTSLNNGTSRIAANAGALTNNASSASVSPSTSGRTTTSLNNSTSGSTANIGAVTNNAPSVSVSPSTSDRRTTTSLNNGTSRIAANAGALTNNAASASVSPSTSGRTATSLNNNTSGIAANAGAVANNAASVSPSTSGRTTTSLNNNTSRIAANAGALTNNASSASVSPSTSGRTATSLNNNTSGSTSYANTTMSPTQNGTKVGAVRREAIAGKGRVVASPSAPRAVI